MAAVKWPSPFALAPSGPDFFAGDFLAADFVTVASSSGRPAEGAPVIIPAGEPIEWDEDA